MKTKLIFIFSIIVLQLSAQDPEFSQSNSSSLILNPAFAGALEHPTIGVGYRNQWPRLTGGYKTICVSYNQYVKKIFGGIGVYFMKDIASNGVLTSNSFHLDYSPSIVAGKGLTIKPAVEFAYIDRNIDWTKLTFGDMIDPMYGFIYPVSVLTTKPATHVSAFDMSLGLLVYHKYFDVGFVTSHLFEPDMSAFQDTEGSALPRKYTVHGSVNIPLTSVDDIFLSPGFLYSKQRDFNQNIFNIALKIDNVLIGMGYADKNSTLFMVGYQCKIIRISYCYDHTVSKLANASASSHEIFLSFFILKEKLKNSQPFMNRVAF